MSVRFFIMNCFMVNYLPGRSLFRTIVRLALLLSFDCKTFRACTLLNLQKVFRSRNFIYYLFAVRSNFQRTLCSGWRLSVAFGFTLCWPASALPIIRFPWLIRFATQLSFTYLHIIFRAVFYRSPDSTNIQQIITVVKFFVLLKVNVFLTGFINNC
jgi:hypothetical protein